jgi:Fe-S cluster biogenesis protein NfuA
LAEQVQDVLDAEVRPYLALHGGDVEVDGLTPDGVLSLRLTGRCSHCPAAHAEISTFVADSVRSRVAGVAEVRAASGVSDGLIAQARRLLRERPWTLAAEGESR